MTVLWWGIFDGFDGYSNAAKEYVRALKSKGVDVVIRGGIGHNTPLDLLPNRDRPDPAPGTYTLVIHMFPWYGTIASKLNEYFNNAKKRIYMTVWEASEIPYQWLEPLKKCDLVMVPSSFCMAAFRRTFQKYGLDIPIKVIPHIVEKIHIDPINAPKYMNQADVNILALSAGTGHRKGLDILIRSFLEEFSPNENVTLYIKSHDTDIRGKYSDLFFHYEQLSSYKDTDTLIPKPSRIVSITGVFSQESQLRALYDETDIFCMVSRGEGFCIPLAEAIVHNRRVVYPVGSKLISAPGTMKLWADDFATDDGETGFGVQSIWNLTSAEEYAGFTRQGMDINTSTMYWTEPLIMDTRQQLRNAVNSRLDGRKEVVHPKAKILSASYVVSKMVEVL